MKDIILEDDQPPQPAEWAWIVQRQETDGKSASIWKFGFIAPDGAEVRVTFHQVSQPTPEQSTPPQPPPNQNQGTEPPAANSDKQSIGEDFGPPSLSGQASSQDVVPEGDPNPDQTGDGVFYVTFFSNRNPEFFAKWDTSLSHEDSLTVWVTVTHGLVDFLRKAKPKNLILDDLGNGKLKMVLRSVTMDVVATDPEYTLELTKKHEYRSFYQIKKSSAPSAFDQVVNGKGNEGETQTPEQPSPVTGPQDMSSGDAVDGGDKDGDNTSKQDLGIAPESSMDTKAASPNSPELGAKPPTKPTGPKDVTPQKGLTIEIGRQDYSIAVKDRKGNVIDRYQGKNPLDILRWINVKGYASNKMKVVDKQTPDGPIAQNREAPEKDMKTQEQFVINKNKIVIHEVFSAKRAAQMNEIVNAEKVHCTMASVDFEFETDKDMGFKKALVELAYHCT